jgi:hypothetical protein
VSNVRPSSTLPLPPGHRPPAGAAEPPHAVRHRTIFAIEISEGPPCRRLALSHPERSPALHMLVRLVALAETFGLARAADYASWSEVEGAARWFHLAEPV